MKRILYTAIYCLISITLQAQPGKNIPWSFLGGSSVIDQPGIYTGTNPRPGARYGAVSWINNNYLWLFGGYGLGANGNLSSQGYLDDLWKYDVINNKWIFVKGNTFTNTGGTYNHPNPNNNKPAGREASMCWKGANGNLWLMGGRSGADGSNGFSNDHHNDLWRFDTTTKIWTWIKGDTVVNQPGLYKHPNPLENRPKARKGGITWTGADGSLWLMGGESYEPSPIGRALLNDLWKFDTTAKIWTWISGDSITNQTGLYTHSNPQKNKPGSRYGAVSWTGNGSLWLMGGTVYYEDETGFDYTDPHNDLWKFDTTTKVWTCVKGDSTLGNLGSYKHPQPEKNRPKARTHAISWCDTKGNFWLMGGAYGGYLNDLWKFDTATKIWTWIKGDSTLFSPGIYNDPTKNTPGSRWGTISWVDASDNLWAFGGYGTDGNSISGFLNDFWKINSSALLPVELLTFEATAQTDHVLLEWTTIYTNEVSHFNVQRSLNGTDFTTLGTVTANNGTQPANYTFPDQTAYQQNVQKLYYRLEIVSPDGSIKLSPVRIVDLVPPPLNLTVLTNPSNGNTAIIKVEGINPQLPAILRIMDVGGRILLQQRLNNGNGIYTIHVGQLATAVYYLEVWNGNKKASAELLKQ